MRFILLVGLLCCSCAGKAVQTDTLLAGPRDVPERAHVGPVPFVQQSKNFCGPATLKMEMAWAGHDVPLDVLGAQTYTPEKQGALQMDMISASRRQGMMAVQIQGLENLLRELAAGHPVIVLENLAFSWYAFWHYSVALGYDLSEPSIIMHSGSKQDWHLDLRKFERNWKYSSYWGLVVLPPGELAVSAGDLEHSAAAAGLEQLGMLDKAEVSYRAILGRWPESFGALIGMGNVDYAKKRYAAAAGFLKRATAVYPSSAAAWNNRATAEGAAGWKRAAAKSAARALELEPGLRESLKEWLPAKAARAEPGRGAELPREAAR
ncbi:MAG: PA2778 family cysteine peptidase [Bdellovibrionota bacterium]